MGCCEICSTIILHGAKTDNLGFEYCTDECFRKGEALKASEKLPSELIQDQIDHAFKGSCPKCDNAGPIEVHFVHHVWSAVVLTRWKSEAVICCRTCATKAQARAAVKCLLLGPWGIPLGPIMALVQAGRNINAIMDSPLATRASKHLQRQIKIRLAEQYQQIEAQRSARRKALE